MPAYLSYTVFGIFVLDENSKVISKLITYPNVDESAIGLDKVNNGESSDHLRELLKTVDGADVDELIVDNQPFSSAVASITDIPVGVQENCKVTRWFRETLDDFLMKEGIVDSKDALLAFRRNVGIQLARITISSAIEERDLLVKHTIDAIDEIDKSINLLTMRIREWYSMHHSSLSSLVEDQEVYVRIIERSGGRTGVTKDILTELGLQESLVQIILEELEHDIGAEWDVRDLSAVHEFSKKILEQYTIRRSLEEYLEHLMSKVAPNITTLVGSIVGARLISLAGSLRELARKPSSTIQIYGAEKALFRSLKTGTDPPKHGIIYQVAEIHSAPYWQRGKIARALAGKLAIAARVDAYSKRDIGKSLRKDFEERVEEIQRQNPEAPPPKPPKPKKRGRKQKKRSGRRKRKGRGGRR